MKTSKLIQELKLDKSNWTEVKLGDVVKEVRKTSQNPSSEGLKRVVSLGDIESENIHLNSWSNIEEGTTFKRTFSPGQVLFGRRRAYLKKAALATFSGLCSGDIIVMEAKKGLDPKLLPFLINNDKFFDFAVANSAGSLSPRAKFKDLANYEFLLPPLEEQGRLAELLWAMDAVVEREKKSQTKLNILLAAQIKEKCLQQQGINYSLSQIIDKLVAGVSVNSQEGIIDKDDFGILKTSSVSSGKFIPTESKKVLDKEISRLKTSVIKDSIIISRMNTPELVGANAYIPKSYTNLFLPDRLWQTEISRKDINVKFLSFILSSPSYRSKISNLCTGTSNSMKNISKDSFLKIKVNIPHLPIQNQAVIELEQIESTISNINAQIINSQSLQKSLINQIF